LTPKKFNRLFGGLIFLGKESQLLGFRRDSKPGAMFLFEVRSTERQKPRGQACRKIPSGILPEGELPSTPCKFENPPRAGFLIYVKNELSSLYFLILKQLFQKGG